MKIIDIHAHYDDSRFADDQSEILTELFDSCADKIIGAATSLESCERQIALAEKYGVANTAITDFADQK